jgi:hypothetical protein
VAKEPLAGDHVGVWWTRHQVPGAVGQHGRTGAGERQSPEQAKRASEDRKSMTVRTMIRWL